VFNLFSQKKQPFDQLRYLVIDMEMTGLDAAENSIISAGTVVIDQGRIQLGSAEHRYFLPTSIMAEDVSETAHIHLITDHKRVSEGQLLQHWLEELNERLLADAWVFHHARIDMSFLKINAARFGLRLPKVKIYDTAAYEQKRRPDEHLQSYEQLNLNSCRKRYNLPPFRQHHALSDAIATAELWLAQNLSRY
jgi:DNA polymerase-3 subunit epsilon